MKLSGFCECRFNGVVIGISEYGNSFPFGPKICESDKKKLFKKNRNSKFPVPQTQAEQEI
jgi:hypothetical protein